MSQKTWWTLKEKEVLDHFETDPQKGLSEEEAKRRLTTFGANILIEERTISFWKIAREEVTEPMILLLLVVGIIYSVWGSLTDAATIFTVVSALVFVEVWNEFRAK